MENGAGAHGSTVVLHLQTSRKYAVKTIFEKGQRSNSPQPQLSERLWMHDDS